MLDEKTAIKRDYLKSYRVLLAKIRRFTEMADINPENAEKYKQGITLARKQRDAIEEKIDRVDGSILSEILSQKYICGKSFEEIAYNMCYSKRQVERLHLKALCELCI